MKADQLLDSKAFCALLGTLVNAMAEDEGLPQALQAVLDAANGQVGVITDMSTYAKLALPVLKSQLDKRALGKGVKALFPEKIDLEPAPGGPRVLVQAKPKRTRRTKAQMAEARLTPQQRKESKEAADNDARTPLTQEEEARYSAEADKLQAATTPKEVVMAAVITDIVKPNLAKGLKSFLIPNSYKNKKVPTSAKVWKEELKFHRVAFNEIDFTYIGKSLGELPPEGYWPLNIV
jgi:hypothetical protein